MHQKYCIVVLYRSQEVRGLGLVLLLLIAMCSKDGNRDDVQKSLLRHQNALFLLLFVVFVYFNERWLHHVVQLQLVEDDDAPKMYNRPAFRTELYRHDQHVTNWTVSTLPIHIIEPSTGHSSVLSWGDLASNWDRHTTFDNIIQLSNESLLPPIPPDHRVVIIMHCLPKMGSRSLRVACKAELTQGCGLTPKMRNDPNGYVDTKEFDQIIRQCNTTQHFCRGVYPKGMKKYDNTVFFHLYPFRNYDLWTISAMKQEYDRRGHCNKLQQLMYNCTDQHGELAFKKYTKTRMSVDRPEVVHRINDIKEVHYTILYPYLEIHALLSVMNEVYQVGLLSGSDGTSHTVRPKNGTCDSAILDKYHECFTSKLTELT